MTMLQCTQKNCDSKFCSHKKPHQYMESCNGMCYYNKNTSTCEPIIKEKEKDMTMLQCTHKNCDMKYCSHKKPHQHGHACNYTCTVKGIISTCEPIKEKEKQMSRINILKEIKDVKPEVYMTVMRENKFNATRIVACDKDGEKLSNIVTIYDDGTMYKHRIKNSVCLKVFQVDNDNKILDSDFNETRNYPTRYTK